MRLAYFLLGFALLLLIGGGFYFYSPTALAPEENIVSNNSKNMNTLSITSPAFAHNDAIPAKYTCDGENINPELIFNGIPANAKSLALIVDDPDIPEEIKSSRGLSVFDHWVMFNIPPDTESIPENTTPSNTGGVSSRGELGYVGPCPPKDMEPLTHRYFFKLYALDTMLDLPAKATKSEVEAVMNKHILAQGELVGLYTRQ
jgi:Raf kinase inhibitor-like YbhB/YbcL family protein